MPSATTWQQQPLQAACSTSSKHSSTTQSSGSLSTPPLGFSTSPAPPFSLEPRTWAQQAAQLTDGLVDASKYKSLAVYAEVRLAEALQKASQACPKNIAGAAPEDCEDGQPLPNPLATAVCCQLLGELAELCGPFQQTLLKLREALLPAIYSSCSGPSLCTGGPLKFDMVPWFAIAGRLRRQNNQLLEQQAAFSIELTQHQEHMTLVEAQVRELQAALEAGTASAAQLQAANAALTAERTAAVAEAAAVTDETKKLAAEVTRLTEEVDEARDQLNTVKEEFSTEQEQWKAQLDVYLQKLHVEAHEREAAVSLAAVEQQELEQKLWEVERRLEEAEQQLQAHSDSTTALQEAQRQQQLLTPRPTNWDPAQALADACKSTAETVHQLQQQHAAELAAVQREVQLLGALSHPDPAPKPWQLNIRAEASKYFLTELDADPTAHSQGEPTQGFSQAAAKPRLFAAGLGLRPEVPKFLRWDETVLLHDMSLEDLEQQVSKLWHAKAAHEARHGPCSLQTFLHEHLWVQASDRLSAAAAAAAAAAAGATSFSTGQLVAADVVMSAPSAAIVAATGDCVFPGARALEEAASQADPAAEPSPAADLATAHIHSQAAAGRDDSAAETSAAAQSSSTASGAPAQPADATAPQPYACAGHLAAAAPVISSAIAAAAAGTGYQLYYACCTHRHSSAAVDVFWLILTGQLPAAVLQEQQQLLHGFAAVLQGLPAKQASSLVAAAPEAGGPRQDITPASHPTAAEYNEADAHLADGSKGGNSSSSTSVAVPWGVVRAGVQKLVPSTPVKQQDELAGCLSAVLGVSSSSSNGSSGTTAHGLAVQQEVTAADLAAVAAALQQELQRRFGRTVRGGASIGPSPDTAAANEPIDAQLDSNCGTASSTALSAISLAAVRRLVDGLLRQHLDLQLRQQ